MKFRLNFAVTIIVPLLVGIATAQTLPGKPLADRMPANLPERPGGPIHFFSFDGAIVDEVTGAVPSLAQGYSATEGYIGGAIHLDGSGMIELPLDLTPEALKNMTIVAMVKPDALPADADLRAEIWPTGYVLSDSEGLIYLSNQNKNTSYFAAYTTGAVISNSAHPALRDGWQMVALTRKQEDRTTAEGDLKPHAVLTLYTNGRISESARLWKGDGAAPTLRLGSISIGRSDKFRGSIDHLIIYNRALTSDELLQLNGVLRQSRNGTSRGLPSSAVGDRQLPGQIDGDQATADSGTGSDQQIPSDMFDEEESSESSDRLGNFSGKSDKLGNFSGRFDKLGNFTGRFDKLGNFTGRFDKLGNFSGKQDILVLGNLIGLAIGDVIGRADRLGNFSGQSDKLGNFTGKIDRRRNFSAPNNSKENGDNTAKIEPIFMPVFTPPISGGSEAPGVSMDQDRIKDASGVTTGSSTVAEGIERVNDAKRARDKAARDEAVRLAGIENSKTIDVADPDLTLPNSREDDLKQITDTKEGQDMLKTADWRLVGVVKRSKMELYPGDEITMTIRVKKDDPANKIPNVVLNVNPHVRGMSNAVLPFRVITNDQNPTASRDIPVTMTVPENLEFPDGADRTSWRLVARLTAENGYVLKDGIPDNHQQQIFLRVDKPAVAEECNKMVENEDGTRTAKECASLFGTSFPAAPDLPPPDRIKFKVDLRQKTETSISGNYNGSFVDVMNFGGRGTLLGFIKIGENRNRPCRIAIDDGVNRGGDPGQVVNQCAGAAGDHEEFRISPNRAITKLQVCLNNQRVKGVRVETRPILANGALGDEVRHNIDLKQQNCSNSGWTRTVSCESGQVAGGVRLSFSGRDSLVDGDGYALDGIGLICGDIIVLPN